MKDLHSGISLAHAFGPVVLAADNTPAAIDLQGFNAAEIILGVGIGGITFDATNKIEFKLTHSDDNSVYSDVVTADMLGVTVSGSGIIKSLVAAHAAAAAYRYGYIGNKRYLKVLADFSGTHGTGTPLFVAVARGRPGSSPTANQA